ncbi:MAG TPA: DUF58 domain-containing protein [Treponemataceae bacterium]|nr:DUF58 domain-containing protein [Treponemataceae bacterium]
MNAHYIADRARYLKLAALSVSEGMRSGGFRSCFRGQGMEFDGVREYEIGDDIRSIDRNVTARSGRPFVKMFREERELTVFLVVDQSLSMDAGPGAVTRREKALEAAALIAFAAELNESPVGAISFDGACGAAFKPRASRDQVLTILSSLDNHRKTRGAVPGSALSGALAGAARALRSRSLVVVVSDFRTTGYEKSLGILARRHDVLAIRITSPVDEALPRAGYVPFRDPETGRRDSFPTGSPAFVEQWARENRESTHRFEHVALRRGVYPLILSTEEDSVRVLSRFFSGRRPRAARPAIEENAL